MRVGVDASGISSADSDAFDEVDVVAADFAGHIVDDQRQDDQLEEGATDGQTAVVIDLRSGDPVVEFADTRLAPVPPGVLQKAPKWQLGIKRAIDIVVSIAAIVVLSPVLVGTALAVKLTSKGPVFFRHARVGKDGEHFEFVKFRSMRNTAVYEKPELRAFNEKSGPIFKIRSDPRVTPVGKVIRRMSIDELPQLFHVVGGTMTLVGPRPHLPEEVATYSPHARRRLSVKPGITCIWQVSGRADLDYTTWIEMDLEYIDTWSLGLDIQLMLDTIPAVLSTRGAY